MTAGVAVPPPDTDAVLLARVRAGDTEAYASLFDRHRGAAEAFARSLAGPNHADDLVAEAFTKVFDALQRDLGPTVSFRSYLLTSVRSLWANLVRGETRYDLVDDYDAMPAPPEALTVFDDPDARFDNAAVGAAYGSLPERWQAVLWYTAVEGLPHAVTAEHLGLKPNAVAALSFRAREGLRQAYLSQHLSSTVDPLCRAMAELLPAYARGSLDRRKRPTLEAHLAECLGCTTALADLEEVNHRLGAILLPVVLGVGAWRIGWPAAADAATARTAASAATRAVTTAMLSAAAAAVVVGTPLVLLSGSPSADDDPTARHPHAAEAREAGRRPGLQATQRPRRVVLPGHPPAGSLPSEDAGPLQVTTPPITSRSMPPSAVSDPSTTVVPERDAVTLDEGPPSDGDPPAAVPSPPTPPPTDPGGISADGGIDAIDLEGVPVADHSAHRVTVGLVNVGAGSTLVVEVTNTVGVLDVSIGGDWTCERTGGIGPDADPGDSTGLASARLHCTFDGVDAASADFRFIVLSSGTSKITATLSPPPGVVDPDLSDNSASATIG